MYAKEYINFKVSPQDIIPSYPISECVQGTCVLIKYSWEVMTSWLPLWPVTCYKDGISCQYCCSECGSICVVTLLQKESHDFRPLPSPQLSPSEMQVDWETMVAWLTWTYIENGMELLMTSYAEAVQSNYAFITYMYRASMFTIFVENFSIF